MDQFSGLSLAQIEELAYHSRVAEVSIPVNVRTTMSTLNARPSLSNVSSLA